MNTCNCPDCQGHTAFTPCPQRAVLTEAIDRLRAMAREPFMPPDVVARLRAIADLLE